MPMRIISIERGGSTDPVKTADGMFDSSLIVTEPFTDATGKIINKTLFTSHKINTLPSPSHPGGFLKLPLSCYGIWFEMFGYPAAALFQSDIGYKNIRTWQDLTEKDRTFESMIPNPNHNGEKIMTLINLHIAQQRSTASDGCSTYHPNDWELFKIFQPGEVSLFSYTEVPKYWDGKL